MKPGTDDGMDDRSSESSNQDSQELPIVHHKKFGEIRVEHSAEMEADDDVSCDQVTLENGCEESPPSLDNFIVNSPVIVNSELDNQFTNNTDLNKMETLSISMLPKCLESASDGTNETPSPNFDQDETASVPDSNENKIMGEISTIRRSNRIKSISSLKQRERFIAGSEVEKPVKMKSRWRRSSEMESHTISVLETEPETPDELLERLEREKRDIAEGSALFQKLTDNEYHCQRVRTDDTMTCDCVLSREEIEGGQMGCGDDCLNRMLFIECCPQCALGENCSNKNFQRKNYAPVQIFKTEKKGFGLKALEPLPKDTFIMEYVGEVVDQREFNRRAKVYAKGDVKHFYFMSLQGDTIIDATSKGNISRFINHSCNPNASTHKWMVNGSLRIGFFSIRSVKAGEEITFDYKFDVYGKSAQQCFCGADNCRGWIGENADEDESEVEESEEEAEEEEEESEESENDVSEETKKVEQPKIQDKPKAKRGRKPKPKENIVDGERMKRKKEESLVEDLGVEEELIKLENTGLKNRAHTLTLSRLMVRAEDWPTRSRLLALIKRGDEPCRRLFLDYRGLRFLHAWMLSTSSEDSAVASQRQIEILATLETLPVPNKTMLIDSKILALLEEWSSLKGGNESESSIAADGEVISLAKKLLDTWSALKEVFKIPKKERMEQMKEHEREADRGYKQAIFAKEQLDHLYSRYKGDRDRDRERDRDRDRDRERDRDRWDNDRKRHRDTPSAADPDWLKNHRERRNLTKHQRRQLFALQVLREDEAARQRVQVEELWNQHQARCKALGLDPHHNPAMDPISGCPIFFDTQRRVWSSAPYPYQYHQPQRFGYGEQSNGSAVPTVQYPNAYMNGPYSSHNIISLTNASPSAQDPRPDVAVAKLTTDDPVLTPVALDVPIILPPRWRTSRDIRGHIFYYHVVQRIAQWVPPQWTQEEAMAQALRTVAAEDDSSSESSESDSDNNNDEDDDDNDEDEEEEQEQEPEHADEEETTPNETEDNILENTEVNDTSPPADEMESNPIEKESPVDSAINSQVELIKISELVRKGKQMKQISSPPPHAGKSNKKRKGLVEERIISPNYETSRGAFRRLKEKLRRRKEQRRKIKTTPTSEEQIAKTERKKKQREKHAAAAAAETPHERKIKENFKSNVAADIVSCLNRYRKPECKNGRITSSEDFKFLARRLTHFVMLKELKHCQEVDDLVCTDSVKVKAKDFVKKYMAKFGPEYEREHD